MKINKHIKKIIRDIPDGKGINILSGRRRSAIEMDFPFTKLNLLRDRKNSLMAAHHFILIARLKLQLNLPKFVLSLFAYPCSLQLSFGEKC